MLFLHRLTLISVSLLCTQLLPAALSPGFTPQAARAESASKSLFDLPIDSKPGRSQGAASRGCDRAENNNVELALLIPSKEVAGQTISARPSFLWTVSHPVSAPIKFTLSRPGDVEPIYEKQVSATKAGIIAIQVPESAPELTPGELYQWTVSLVCNEKRPSANPFFASWIERVAPRAGLETAVTAANNDRDRAIAFARAGLWYDALETFYRAKVANPHDARLEADFNALLASVGLNEQTTASR